MTNKSTSQITNPSDTLGETRQRMLQEIQDLQTLRDMLIGQTSSEARQAIKQRIQEITGTDGSTTGSKELDELSRQARDAIIESQLQKPEGLGTQVQQDKPEQQEPEYKQNHRGEWIQTREKQLPQTNTGESFAEVFARINKKK